MKAFAIRDGYENTGKNLAYLIYYEKEKTFYIELPEEADEWETPLLLSSFVKRGEKTVNAYFSRLWVQQRIVPPDRQNLGRILRENGLREYDEFALLMLANGRCAQDDYYLAPVSKKTLLSEFPKRYAHRVEEVVPLENATLLVFFRNGEVKKCAVQKAAPRNEAFRPVLNREELFCQVGVQVGGYGICWGENLAVSDEALYRTGQKIGLEFSDFVSFLKYRTVNAEEAARLLECSRQNISDLVKRGKLHPVKTGAKNTLFLKSEILQRKWE